MRALAIAAVFALAACGGDPKVVVRAESVLPADPSPDLLSPPSPVVIAGSKDANEAIGRLSLGIVQRDQLLAGWRGWWGAARAGK